MADVNSGSHKSSSLVPYHRCLPQAAGQDAGSSRLAAVAAHASCATYHPINILRLPDVMKRVGLKRAAIYLRITQGTFPKQISLGGRAVGWLEHEVDAWLAAHVSAARGNGGDLTSA